MPGISRIVFISLVSASRPRIDSRHLRELATFCFEVRNLYVDRAVLGKSFAVADLGHRVALAFPMTDSRERAMLREPSSDPDPAPHFPPDKPEIPWTRNAAHLLLSDRALPSERHAIIDIVRAHVFFEGDVSAADLESEDAAADWADRGAEAYELAYPAAEAAILRLISWARTDGRQWWLGLTDEAADPIHHTELVDCDANRRLPIGGAPWRQTKRLFLNTGLAQLPREDAIAHVLSGAFEAPLAESLLADAIYFASYAEPPDLRRAVLSAAIACELKIRATLSRVVSAEAAPLLGVLLAQRPRARTLFDAPMRAVSGRSLTEDAQLHAHIQKLFGLRNDVAHEGLEPPMDEGSAVIAAAAEVFRWLDTIPAAR